jgi:hypothetical protein
MSVADGRLLTPEKKNMWETFKHRRWGCNGRICVLAAVSLSA